MAYPSPAGVPALIQLTEVGVRIEIPKGERGAKRDVLIEFPNDSVDHDGRDPQ